MPHDPKNSKNEQHVENTVRRFKSELEDIDFALFNYVNDKLDISTSTNKGFRKVPVVWAGSERAHSIKNDDYERDEQGMIILPLISIERTGVKKSINKRTIPYAVLNDVNDIKGGGITVNRIIQQKKTSEFANADAKRKRGQDNAPIYRHGKKNEKIVYETITIPIPIYVECGYKVQIVTEYQEQMNDILTPFIRTPNAQKIVMITHGENTYEAFVQENYTTNNSVANYQSNERRYVTDITIDVLGYLIGDGKNQAKPRIVRRENAVQVRFAKERVIMDPDQDGEFRF